MASALSCQRSSPPARTSSSRGSVARCAGSSITRTATAVGARAARRTTIPRFAASARARHRRPRGRFWRFSLYAFCRWTDDLGDEAEGDRLQLLDEWERELRACYDGRRSQPLFVALCRTIEQFDIPTDPFLRLIEANRMDQRITRFATYD